MDFYFGNPNPKLLPNMTSPNSSEFMLSDYLVFDDHQESCLSQSTGETESSEKAPSNGGDVSHRLFGDESSTNNNNMKSKNNGIKRHKVEVSSRVMFRTRSQLEIMDDGYKWRKYGKKSVKNSPNPRNYFKCSGEGCSVKKRVERDRDDSSYVLTTYDGVHNHESPCNSNYHYTQLCTLVHSSDWSPQQPSAANYSSSSFN